LVTVIERPVPVTLMFGSGEVTHGAIGVTRSRCGCKTTDGWMNLDQVMAQLKQSGSEKMRELYKRHGAGDQQFGVNRSDLRKLAAQLKTNHELALELWQTGNIDAMLLATLLMRPTNLSQADIEKMIKACKFYQLVDWFVVNVVKAVSFKDKLSTKWSAAQR
jgi:3-methyladenine DNA glycosylase AlkD